MASLASLAVLLAMDQPVYALQPRGIDDVPIVALTVWTADPTRSAYDLQQVARAVHVGGLVRLVRALVRRRGTRRFFLTLRVRCGLRSHRDRSHAATILSVTRNHSPAETAPESAAAIAARAGEFDVVRGWTFYMPVKLPR